MKPPKEVKQGLIETHFSLLSGPTSGPSQDAEDVGRRTVRLARRTSAWSTVTLQLVALLGRLALSLKRRLSDCFMTNAIWSTQGSLADRSRSALDVH